MKVVGNLGSTFAQMFVEENGKDCKACEGFRKSLGHTPLFMLKIVAR